ncbi:MAG: tetratricopeptide repeat protein [Gammaproteobacteria bacterium]|nr:tetratricopeptide repeat protein [Gammaproteobacteria bacterium]
MERMITSSVPAAAETLTLAIDNFVNRKAEVAPLLARAIELDPDCTMAHAMQGLMLQIARNSNFRPMMQQAHEGANRHSAAASVQEQEYVAALNASVAGDITTAVGCYESILQTDPTDAFALALCQSELFWLGEMNWSENISARVEHAWAPGTRSYPAYLAMRAFDLEETGQFTAAEARGREAVELEPGNVWGAHAVAHVLLMRGRSREGGQWLDQLQGNWDDANQLKFHLWWHRCLFYLEQRELDAVLDVYDRWVRNRDDPLVQALPDLYIDLQNGSSLLWRLEQAGINVGDRWLEMAELAESRLDDLTSPFTSAHFAMILAATGNTSACTQLVDNMRSYNGSLDTLAVPYERAAIPAALASIAHRQGDFTAVVEHLYPARRLLWQMGGSHAQQDIFMQMLHDAATRCGRDDVARIVLHDLEMQGFVEPHQRLGYELVAAAQ